MDDATRIPMRGKRNVEGEVINFTHLNASANQLSFTRPTSPYSSPHSNLLPHCHTSPHSRPFPSPNSSERLSVEVEDISAVSSGGDVGEMSDGSGVVKVSEVRERNAPKFNNSPPHITPVIHTTTPSSLQSTTAPTPPTYNPSTPSIDSTQLINPANESTDASHQSPPTTSTRSHSSRLPPPRRRGRAPAQLFRTDTVEAIFGGYWLPPADSKYQWRVKPSSSEVIRERREARRVRLVKEMKGEIAGQVNRHGRLTEPISEVGEKNGSGEGRGKRSEGVSHVVIDTNSSPEITHNDEPAPTAAHSLSHTPQRPCSSDHPPHHSGRISLHPQMIEMVDGGTVRCMTRSTTIDNNNINNNINNDMNNNINNNLNNHINNQIDCEMRDDKKKDQQV
eukprot:GHVN01011123.1.p1 GENE.GHVN01011123.1~~GHVN01011123.1.p1  ORF type:complete len:431 (+),score=168.55 GHVN01011123.1:117-1295(+)